jgi:hypothetical protein
MSAISQDARALYGTARTAAPLSVRSAVTLWLASSGLLWAAVAHLVRVLA